MVAAAGCGLLFAEDSGCGAVTGCVGGASALLAVVAVSLRPHDALLDTLQSVAANGLAAVAAVVALTTDSVDAAADVLWSQTAVAFASLGLSLWGIIWELWATGTTSHRGCRTMLLLLYRCRAFFFGKPTTRSGTDGSSSETSRCSDSDSNNSRGTSRPRRREGAPLRLQSQCSPEVQQERLERLVKQICRSQQHQQKLQILLKNSSSV